MWSLRRGSWRAECYRPRRTTLFGSLWPWWLGWCKSWRQHRLFRLRHPRRKCLDLWLRSYKSAGLLRSRRSCQEWLLTHKNRFRWNAKAKTIKTLTIPVPGNRYVFILITCHVGIECSIGQMESKRLDDWYLVSVIPEVSMLTFWSFRHSPFLVLVENIFNVVT